MLQRLDSYSRRQLDSMCRTEQYIFLPFSGAFLSASLNHPLASNQSLRLPTCLYATVGYARKTAAQLGGGKPRRLAAIAVVSLYNSSIAIQNIEGSRKEKNTKEAPEKMHLRRMQSSSLSHV